MQDGSTIISFFNPSAEEVTPLRHCADCVTARLGSELPVSLTEQGDPGSAHSEEVHVAGYGAGTAHLKGAEVGRTQVR